MENPIHCKNCDSTHIVKYGTYNGVQRYWCKVCKRKFKGDDTTFHMKTPANQVSSALNMYYEGMSIKAIRRQLQQEHGNMSSTATIYEWIQKYTQYAIDSAKDYHPKVGDTWVADETVLEIDGQNVWFWDIVDNRTRYLLASRISRSRTTRDAQMLMDRAFKTAGKTPKVIITDQLASYLDVRYGKDADILYVADADQVFKTEDTGDYWEEVGDIDDSIVTGWPTTSGEITSITVGYADDEPHAYAGVVDTDTGAPFGDVFHIYDVAFGGAWGELDLDMDVYGIGASPDFDNDTLVVAIRRH